MNWEQKMVNACIPSLPEGPFAPDLRQESKGIHQESQVEAFEAASLLDDISPVSLLLPVR